MFAQYCFLDWLAIPRGSFRWTNPAALELAVVAAQVDTESGAVAA